MPIKRLRLSILLLFMIVYPLHAGLKCLDNISQFDTIVGPVCQKILHDFYSLSGTFDFALVFENGVFVQVIEKESTLPSTGRYNFKKRELLRRLNKPDYPTIENAPARKEILYRLVFENDSDIAEKGKSSHVILVIFAVIPAIISLSLAFVSAVK